jgi:hypothetical protein
MIGAGVVDDSDGKTSYDHDVVIFNDFWFPFVKPATTEGGRNAHYPAEGVYAVAEVKQTLDFRSLDDAMEKLVKCSRLKRPLAKGDRIVENRRGMGMSSLLSNPLYTAVIATGLGKGVDFQAMEERFVKINAMLPRLENVRCLCVLGKGCINWTWLDKDGNYRPAYFQGMDLFHPIVPVLTTPDESKSAFYPFLTDLLLHLYHSILAAEDIANEYGLFQAISPNHASCRLDPDQEILNILVAEGSMGNLPDVHSALMSRERHEEHVRQIYRAKYGIDIELRPGPLEHHPCG